MSGALGHPIDLHVDLVKVPAPLPTCTHRVHRPAADLGRKHRAKPVPPVPHCRVANRDATLVQRFFDVSERQRKPDAGQHRPADDIGARLEIVKAARSFPAEG